MKANIKLNRVRAKINALEVQISSLKEDIDKSFFPVSHTEKEELKRMQKLISTLDSAFWDSEGELK